MRTSWVSFMYDRGDHFPSGVKMCLAFSNDRVARVLTAFTRQAAVNDTT